MFCDVPGIKEITEETGFPLIAGLVCQIGDSFAGNGGADGIEDQIPVFFVVMPLIADSDRKDNEPSAFLHIFLQGFAGFGGFPFSGFIQDGNRFITDAQNDDIEFFEFAEKFSGRGVVGKHIIFKQAGADSGAAEIFLKVAGRFVFHIAPGGVYFCKSSDDFLSMQAQNSEKNQKSG